MKEQLVLFKGEDCTGSIENKDYLTKQLITYIGNKRSLLAFIGDALCKVKKELGRNKIKCLDMFSGSGIVARYLKQSSELIIANDIEKYSEVIGKCYLSNRTEININKLKSIYDDIKKGLLEKKLEDGFIADLYAPKNEKKILKNERVFYTLRNARYLDNARQLIEKVERKYRDYLLAPLLSEASIHANTSGVFKGFYKDSGTGIGKFGGNNGDALTRILGEIEMQFPIFSSYECDWKVYREDANKLVKNLPEVDLAYLDPPYNQHPYGSNYFMLNLLVDYKRPDAISNVSGIPEAWFRSAYNKKQMAKEALFGLIKDLKAKYILISFNSEGFINKDEMIDNLKHKGKVELFETKYNTFRGSRNLEGRSIHVKEQLYLVKTK